MPRRRGPDRAAPRRDPAGRPLAPRRRRRSRRPPPGPRLPTGASHSLKSAIALALHCTGRPLRPRTAENGSMPAATVDEYIAAFPPDVRERLERVRAAVHRVLPDAAEAIKYGMPAVLLGGRHAIYF